MDPYRPRSRLGTSPEPTEPIEPAHAAPARELPLELVLTFRLDRPFHELKERLVSELERAYLARCLAASENLSAASRLSGLSRKHLRTLMTKYGMVRRAGLELDDGVSDDGVDDGPDPRSRA